MVHFQKLQGARAIKRVPENPRIHESYPSLKRCIIQNSAFILEHWPDNSVDNDDIAYRLRFIKAHIDELPKDRHSEFKARSQAFYKNAMR
jgi:hypothetical protein